MENSKTGLFTFTVLGYKADNIRRSFWENFYENYELVDDYYPNDNSLYFFEEIHETCIIITVNESVPSDDIMQYFEFLVNNSISNNVCISSLDDGSQGKFVISLAIDNRVETKYYNYNPRVSKHMKRMMI